MDFEFYETPQTFTRYLFREMRKIEPICGTVCEPCVGSGAIPRAAATLHDELGRIWTPDQWVTNDLDPRWSAGAHEDARRWMPSGHVDWSVGNPPFTPAVEIINQTLEYSRVGVAMHLRASIHEVLKTGIRRTWLNFRQPSGILWLPRFAYQRSKTTGKWTTDSVCACWVIWLKGNPLQFIRYAPEWVLDELEAETPAYRKRMDQIMAERAGTVALACGEALSVETDSYKRASDL
jgi:hypothetical protein